MKGTSPDTARQWRSLEELVERDDFREWVAREHPDQAARLADPVERREVLKLLGASLALAGFTGACTRQPDEAIVPYAREPEDTIPGRPLLFATSMPWSTGALGLLVESHMGRPTKVEGNPDHPASLGAADAIAQAQTLGLYDPGRSQVVSEAGEIRTWADFLTDLVPVLERLEANGGAGLRVLTPPATSPTLAARMGKLAERFPQFGWVQYEPVNRDQARAGAGLAFGADVTPVHRYDRARVVVALDEDVLGGGPAGVLAARQIARGRDEHGPGLPRLYSAETSPSITGGRAAHRLPVSPSQLDALARALAKAVGATFQGADGAALPEAHAAWVDAASSDLARHRGECLVVAGAWAPPAVHALAHAMNAALGNVGSTVTYVDPPEVVPGERTSALRQLVAEMRAGAVEVLAILGANPVYDAPADLGFGEALAAVPFTVHLGLYDDETSRLCLWHVPETHFLEAWGDARAADGTLGVVQPLIAPLYKGKAAIELAATFAGEPLASDHDLVREHWRTVLGDDGFEKAWNRVLHDGLAPATAASARSVTLGTLVLPDPTPAPEAGALVAVWRPDPKVWDGRFAGNGWLQECPHPVTKVVWDNAALVAPATASRLGLEDGRVCEISFGERVVRAPIGVCPGHAEDCVTLPLGYGRRRGGSVGDGVGFDAYRLRSSAAPWSEAGVLVQPTDETHRLVTTQTHHSMEGRDLVRVVGPGDPAKPGAEDQAEHGGTSDASHDEEGHGSHGKHGDLSIYPEWEYEGHAWGMVIDLNACTGCNACVVACQSENNIPIVGREEVARGREMHWIRIDRYYEGDADLPRVRLQPIPCMHCENAPCEVVCPVAATTHSPEGLNEMTYNRCVGTRYCANNCPYKVRRFNFFHYVDLANPSLELGRNPDVTVRSRGVMEKCTYCVQRINAARIEALKEDRPVADGEVVTACQQTCPAEAIVFGDINDPASRVSKARGEARHYGLLEELNTKPRTTYLADVDDPNPELEGA